MKRSWTKNAGARLHAQRPWLLLMSAMVSLLLLVGSTFAWFTQSDSVSNPFKTKEFPFTFEVDEVFTPPAEPGPGDNVEKEVKVKNTGELPGFVRVLLLTEIIGGDGTPLPAGAGVVAFEDVAPITDWILGPDGWWYYLDKLEPGDSTPAIVSGVTFAPGLPPEYENAAMKIEVKVEAAELKQWVYREGWWGSAAVPTDATLLAVDNRLEGLTYA